MSIFESQTVSSVLGQSQTWADWCKFLEQTSRPTAVPSGETAVHLLRRFLDAKDIGGATLLTLVRKRFAIERLGEDDTRGFPLPGQGWVRVARPVGELFGSEAQIAVGEATASRRHSVEAHEIGHLFYATLADRLAAVKTDHSVRSEAAERFCWDFALEMFCPRGERLRWNAAYLRDLLKTNEQRAVSELRPRELRPLTFWHIRALAQRHAISMRMVVVALDRHPLLDEVGFGISVLKRMPNPATSHDVGLRVWQRARPSWGFLVINQRAIKQGFLSAGTIFDRGENQKTVTHRERLRLRFCCPQEDVKWPVRNVETTCAYTPVDVKSEGRYLLVTWPWPIIDK